MHSTASAGAHQASSVPFASLYQAFATLPDPRRKAGTRYPLAAILTLAVVAILANHRSVLAMAEWGASQAPHVIAALGFRRGVTPHQSTLHRLFARLDPTQLATVLTCYFDPRQPGDVRPRGSQGVACDGKAQRGRLRHNAHPTHPIHAVSAFCHDVGVVLAQIAVDAQQHAAELTVAPALLRQVDWEGRVLTGDALYCQQRLCAQVVEAGGDYLFIVKENQPTLVADIAQVFAPLSAEEAARTGVHTVVPMAITSATTVEKGHGRIDERRIRVSSELAGYTRWPYLAQIFEWTRTWTVGGKRKQQVRYGITSLPADVCDAHRLLMLKREHWSVENRLHYVKDVTLGEDASQIAVGHGADVLSMLRNTAVGVLRKAGHTRMAMALRYYSGHPAEALALVGIMMGENA
jgi:predicted transposase YbfD/YdcC